MKKKKKLLIHLKIKKIKFKNNNSQLKFNQKNN